MIMCVCVSAELFDILLWGSVALVGLSSLVTGVRYAANRMDPRCVCVSC